jgi:DNA processing protein
MDARRAVPAALATALHADETMTDSLRLDAVALGLAAGSQPARAAATLKARLAEWPTCALAAGLEALDLHGPGASAHWRAEARRTLERAEALGYGVIWPAHSAYPPLLAAIVDPPLLLWTCGDLDCLAEPAVALVGSRQATAAGRDVARVLAAGLAAAGVVVASGFARGIDAAAHRGALSTGRSLAVLGCGLDVPYPRDHDDLRRQLAASGVLVSEFPPGLPPQPHHFPLRNRTLSGLCHAVVVVQAAERSGSLITARLALEQGRDVMAVPGDVRTGANAGGHALIRDGARLVERASDVLEELGWRQSVGRAGCPRGTSDPEEPDGRLGEPSLPKRLLHVLAREDGVTLDELLSETGRTSADLLGELLDLELEGLVHRDVVGRFLPSERKW